MTRNILLFGVGPMGIEYTKIMTTLGFSVTAVGRGEQSAAIYKKETGFDVIVGGVEQWLKDNPSHQETMAIVAVGEKWLGDVTVKLIKSGVKKILVEKPGGIDFADIESVAKEAKTHGAQVFVGYNRRFYASVAKAQEIIAQDGGLQSFYFEFTEWGHVIADLQKEPGVKENWFMANSSHVIDLAFYIGGQPKQLQAYTSGRLDWHPSAAVFTGAGEAESGALFSYHANWAGPGRWYLEFVTKAHRLYFKPIEQLQIQKLGSVAVEPVVIDDSIDHDFKPGLYHQVKAFLEGSNTLPSIEEQVAMLPWYKRILHGTH